MPNMNIGMMRTQTRPGDMLIRVFTGGAIGGVISFATNDSQFVHGGIAVGQNRMVEVNGGLNADRHTGQGRILANIYLTDLMTDLKDVTYVCYRPTDAGLGEDVAIQAYPFARRGVDKSFGYNISAAVKSTPLWRSLFGSAKGEPKEDMAIDENESVLSVAMAGKKSFFCTQFMVWIYGMTAKKTGRAWPFPLQAKDAYPGALVSALDASPLFAYQGVIRGLSG